MEFSKKIKILHVIPSLDTGGAERLLLDICKTIDSSIFELVVVCFKRGGLWEKEISAHAKLIVIKRSSRFNFFSILKLRNTIIKEKPDIVHTHLGGDIYGRWFAGRLHIPVVSTEHNINQDESSLVTLAKRLTIKYAQKIIAVSGAVGHDIVNRYKISSKKIIVIHNGIDISRFVYAAPQFKTPIKIGSIGRLVEQKDFKTLIEACSLLKTKDFSLQIAGQGNLKGELEAQIKNLKLEDSIKLIGQEENVADFLQSLDIFVLPSRWEGLGIAILEAGAAGPAVIASNVDGIKEIILDKDNGLLFSAGDVHALAANIQNLIDNPSYAQELSLAMQRTVVDKFTIQTMVSRYEDVYKQIRNV